MKISIRDEDSHKRINIRLPMFAIITFVRLGKWPSNIDIDNDVKQNIANEIFKIKNKKALIKGLKYLNKNHKGLVLVDVEDPRGNIVKIEI